MSEFSLRDLIRGPVSEETVSQYHSLFQKCPLRYANTTLSLDLCPEFIRDVVGQDLFLFHISKEFLPISEGRPINVEK